MMGNTILLYCLLCALLGLAACKSLIPHHNYWFQNSAPASETDSDRNWNYCDLKCMYLEVLAPGKDFVVVKFNQKFKEMFAACYVRSDSKYILWNKIIQNSFYEKACGGDSKDWYNQGFKVQGFYGVGVGTPVTTKTV